MQRTEAASPGDDTDAEAEVVRILRGREKEKQALGPDPQGWLGPTVWDSVLRVRKPRGC